MGKHKKPPAPPQDAPASEDVPKSFVLHRGKVSRHVSALVGDMRGVMSPNTASKLKVMKRNVLKDFVNIAGPLGITHMVMFTQSEAHVNMYCLARDVLSSLEHPKLIHASFMTAPLLVLNNFPKDTPAMQLMTKVFQNLFPSINVGKVDLRSIRRVVLFNYNSETNLIDFRHYDIAVRASGTSRSVRSVIATRLPNLGDFEDIADFVLRGAQGYESEGEDASSHVVLPQTVHGVGNKEAAQSAIRLSELGPRLQLRLLKIEEGLCGGNVLYHALVKKTPKEIAALAKRRQEMQRLKAIRKEQQAENVRRKMEAAGSGQPELDSDGEAAEEPETVADENDFDDDAEYYREAVGEEPPAELALGKKFFKRRNNVAFDDKRKKRRDDPEGGEKREARGNDRGSDRGKDRGKEHGKEGGDRGFHKRGGDARGGKSFGRSRDGGGKSHSGPPRRGGGVGKFRKH